MAIIARILGDEELALWDDFVASASHGGVGSIHQISSWGRFQQAARGEGAKWWIIGLFETPSKQNNDMMGRGKLIGGGLVLKRGLGMGKCWLYCPKGPILDYQGPAAEEAVAAWITVVDALAKEEKAVFLRVEPGLVQAGPDEVGVKADFNWRNAGFVGAHAHYQPENTVMVDLRPDEGQILAQMKPKGRYNIKLAEKKGVEVLIAGEDDAAEKDVVTGKVGGIGLEEGVAAFHELLLETTARDKFGGHPAGYYLNMLRTLGPAQAKLYLARFQGEIIAGVLVTFFGDLAIYYFGASGGRHRNLMAPYLLQWRAMQEARRRGCKWYDFLGTAPLIEVDAGEFIYDAKHSWAGVTEFKLKFGGEKVDFYPGAEKVYDGFFYLVMKLRKKMRYFGRSS